MNWWAFAGLFCVGAASFAIWRGSTTWLKSRYPRGYVLGSPLVLGAVWVSVYLVLVERHAQEVTRFLLGSLCATLTRKMWRSGRPAHPSRSESRAS